MKDSADYGDAEIKFEVAVMVPAERRDAVALFDAEFFQGVCELFRALSEISESVAMNIVCRARDYFLFRKILASALENQINGQLPVHHCVVHHQYLSMRV